MLQCSSSSSTGLLILLRPRQVKICPCQVHRRRQNTNLKLHCRCDFESSRGLLQGRRGITGLASDSPFTDISVSAIVPRLATGTDGACMALAVWRLICGDGVRGWNEEWRTLANRKFLIKWVVFSLRVNFWAKMASVDTVIAECFNFAKASPITPTIRLNLAQL